MDDDPIPCAHPRTAPTIIHNGDMLRITVGEQSTFREYEIHIDALTQQSHYFKNLVPPPSTQSQPPVHLPLSPSRFRIFITWLYSSKLDSSDETRLSYLNLCGLYAFGALFGIPGLCNRVVDVVYMKMETQGTLPYDVMAYLETEARDSGLRDLLVDVMVQFGVGEEMAGWKVNLAKGMRVQSAKGVEIVRGEGLKRFLEEVRDSVCERYHVHGVDGCERVGGDGWFFDPPLVAEGLMLAYRAKEI